jgi:hypothetical protein
MNEIPEKLYRGVVRKHTELDSILEQNDMPMTPPNEPIIDEDGEKYVGDGNEYGVYMTTNENMARAAYGNPRTWTTPLEPRVEIDNERREVIGAPRIGVIHEIDTNGVDVRIPKINGPMKGLYNNGFQGDEYIADSIPANNHKIKQFRVGADLLHDGIDIDVDEYGIGVAAEKVRETVERRLGRLSLLTSELTNMTDARRRGLSSNSLYFIKLRKQYKDEDNKD